MPNRLIKDSIRFSEKVNSLTDFQFRLWVSLITYVDDYGRGDARPAVIKGTCFPLRDRITNKDIDAALNALAGAGCVGLYEVDGKPYLYFPNWQSHQNIRNKKSRFPAPENATCNQLHTIASNCKQMHTNVPVIQSESARVRAGCCFERFCGNAEKDAQTAYRPRPFLDACGAGKARPR